MDFRCIDIYGVLFLNDYSKLQAAKNLLTVLLQELLFSL